ncbi:stage III sporulation protein AF [Thermoactinomyces mirandus]|uniref:Stage III sporulation protein AF n=1 Tax=Thermoactinomyces mirandus TaxID=2756294 RepID=A0A7W1XPI2_9BACL|nr:stage III sporulation protein AF [Thermoactinomyces mirandus]MBA4600903.1 stage III sporulation protein AF [Thermoactinomyces mirandus]
MISWMSDWLKQIVLLVLIATFIDLLLPNSRLDRYVKLVMGLLIVMAILSPIFGLLSDDLDLESLAFLPSAPAFSPLDSMEEIEQKSEALKQEQQQMVRQQAEQKISQSIKAGLEKHFPVEVKKSEVRLRMGDDTGGNEVERVSVSILPQESDSKTGMKPVEPVYIDLDPAVSAPKKETEPDVRPLKQDVMRYIEKNWEVPMENIDVEIYRQKETSLVDHRVYLT